MYHDNTLVLCMVVNSPSSHDSVSSTVLSIYRPLVEPGICTKEREDKEPYRVSAILPAHPSSLTTIIYMSSI